MACTSGTLLPNVHLEKRLQLGVSDDQLAEISDGESRAREGLQGLAKRIFVVDMGG
jgi:hypothetical protein